MKKTDWFPADVKPVHAGLYETKSEGCVSLYLWEWDGSQWIFPRSREGSGEFAGMRCMDQNRDWRGLFEKQEKTV